MLWKMFLAYVLWPVSFLWWAQQEQRVVFVSWWYLQDGKGNNEWVW